MTLSESQLVQLVRDAIAMLRWQAREPLAASTWAEWISMAIEIVDRCVNQPVPREMVEGDL